MHKVARLVGAAAVLLSGCGMAEGQNGQERHAGEPRPALHASLAKNYNTIEELKKDSVAIVRATAAGSSPRSVNGLPMTATTVNVSHVYWGKVPARSLSVEQLGSVGVDSHDTSALLTAGNEYILFLMPFHMTPGDNTGVHLVTGEQGAWIRKPDEAGYTFIGAGSDATRLPRQLDTTNMDTLAAR